MTESLFRQHRPGIRLMLLMLAVFALRPLSADTISFSADSMKGNTGQDQESVTLSGRAWISTDKVEIRAETIELTGSDYRLIKATGNVAGTNKESGLTFTAETMNFDRKTDIVKLEGGVTLHDQQNGVNATASVIEYDQNTEIAVLQINVHLTNKDSDCTAALATYRKKDKMLEMSGSPKIVRGKDTFTAQEILFNLDTEEITLDGKVRGTVTENSGNGEAGR